jgi:hypothetical protein
MPDAMGTKNPQSAGGGPFLAFLANAILRAANVRMPKYLGPAFYRWPIWFAASP